MKLRHFEALKPVCPVCLAAGNGRSGLRLTHTVREQGQDVIEGVLVCTDANCLREFPILDGVPLLVADIRQFVSDNLLAIYGRRDVSGLIESLLGDCCGPGSLFDQMRQHASSYTWDHYGDLDADEAVREPRPGSMLQVLEVGRRLADPVLPGPVIDVGCAVGRGSFALAERSDELVVGVDLNFAMLRLASEVLRQGAVRYPRRRGGLVYDRREFPARFAKHAQVDFWACDATALPFAEGTFSLAVNMNVLDCVRAPQELLGSLARVLKPGAKAVLACPYDWSPAATPVEAWLGGHSQRSPSAGDSAVVLRELLARGTPAPGGTNWQLLAQRDDLPWHVRLHDRSTMVYKVHLVVAARTGQPDT